MIKSNKQQKEFVLIDGSWYIFNKYFATISYFKQKNKDKHFELGDPTKNEEFINDFKISFLETIKKLDETLNIRNPTIIVGKDCKRRNIWRMELYKDYKSNRKDHPYLSFFFKLAYEELYKEAGVNKILTHDKLEADDCIALYTKFLSDKYHNCKIKIMTTDADYFQLIKSNIEIIKPAKRKELTDPYTFISTNIDNCDPEEQLFCKICSGDKSDNIQNIFPGCGPKTAAKLFKDKLLFKKILNDKVKVKEIYDLNEKLIDMKNIPDYIKKEFYKTNFSNKRDNPFYNLRNTKNINYNNKKQKYD